MPAVIAVILSIVMGFMWGIMAEESHIQSKCVAKYADMPHNKVDEFCKTLLKFEPATK